MSECPSPQVCSQRGQCFYMDQADTQRLGPTKYSERNFSTPGPGVVDFAQILLLILTTALYSPIFLTTFYRSGNRVYRRRKKNNILLILESRRAGPQTHVLLPSALESCCQVQMCPPLLAANTPTTAGVLHAGLMCGVKT